MAKQRIKKVQVSAKLEEAFPRFVASATARGVSDKTIQTYHEHIHCVGKHIDLSMTFLDLEQEDLEEMIVSMRESGLSHNSIASYTRVFRTFLKWCREQGLVIAVFPVKGKGADNIVVSTLGIPLALIGGIVKIAETDLFILGNGLMDDVCVFYDILIHTTAPDIGSSAQCLLGVDIR